MPRTDNQTLIEQLLGVKSWPVFFYEIQIKDKGKGTAGTGTFTADNKAWDDNEWITDTAFNNASFTDRDGTTFTISDNSDDTLTLSGTPVTGDFELKRWLYLVSYSEGYVGTYLPITYNSKSYLPYPVKIGNLGSYELGQFPQVSLSMPNPGIQVLDVYRALEKYNGLRGCTVNIITAFIDENGDLYDDIDIQLIDQFIIQQPTITNTLVTFVLQNFGNLSDKVIPVRTYSKQTCGFIYQDKSCKNCGITPTCTKLLSELLFNNLVLTHTSENVFSTTEDLSRFSESEVEVLIGCKVMLGTKHTNLLNYVWEITDFDSTSIPNTLTICSSSGTKKLSDSGTIVTVDIIDKFSCKGHIDSGNLDTPVASSSAKQEKGNLLVNSHFSSGWTIIDGIPPGNISSNGLLIEKTSGSQSIHIEQNVTIANEVALDLPQLELGHHYILSSRYYGYSVETGVSSFFRVWIRIRYHSAYYFFNFITKTWIQSALGVFDNTNSLQVQLRSSEFKINLNDAMITQNIKQDEYYCMIPFNITPTGNAPHTISNFIVRIGSQSTDTSLFNVIIRSFGFYRFIQTEHYGGFPAMPMAKLWYI